MLKHLASDVKMQSDKTLTAKFSFILNIQQREQVKRKNNEAH